jgi:hypothetical protein
MDNLDVKHQLQLNEKSGKDQWWNDKDVDWDRYFIRWSTGKCWLVKYGADTAWKVSDDDKQECSRCGAVIYKKVNGMYYHQQTKTCIDRCNQIGRGIAQKKKQEHTDLVRNIRYVKCECGIRYKWYYRKQHFVCKTHLKYLDTTA